MTLPSRSRSCTGRPTRSCGERSSGTWTLASSACVLVDGRDDGAVRHAIADPDGNVADDARLRRVDAIELQLDAAFANLRFERGEPRLGGAQRVLRLIELRLADRAGSDERVEALDLLTPVLHVSFGAGAVGFRARHGRALLRFG